MRKNYSIRGTNPYIRVIYPSVLGICSSFLGTYPSFCCLNWHTICIF